MALWHFAPDPPLPPCIKSHTAHKSAASNFDNGTIGGELNCSWCNISSAKFRHFGFGEVVWDLANITYNIEKPSTNLTLVNYAHPGESGDTNDTGGSGDSGGSGESGNSGGSGEVGKGQGQWILIPFRCGL